MRTLFAVDIQNLFFDCRDTYGKDARVDYKQLFAAAIPVEQRKQSLARAYLVGKHGQDDSKFIAMLEAVGYMVRKRSIEQDGSDWDTGIVVETMRDVELFDRFVLASGDGDFTVLLRQLKMIGKSVAVMAFSNSLSRRLPEAADYTIQLDDDKFVWGGKNHGK